MHLLAKYGNSPNAIYIEEKLPILDYLNNDEQLKNFG